MTRWLTLLLFGLSLAPFATAQQAKVEVKVGGTVAVERDWLHWRGPEQNGHSKETGIPADFSLTTPGKNNLIWKQPYGGRSAPLIMAGKLYMIQGHGEGMNEGERIICLDANTGKIEWESRVGVFHTDIVSSRLGWTSLAADPSAGTIFAHTTAGHMMCLDAKTGETKWKRQLTEEFGRVTGYGGRIVSPVFDSGLVIVGIANGSWGDQARGGNRFVAFDSKTGEVVWWQEVTSVARPLKGTYYSNPVVAVINGQRVLITGGADGGVHGLKVRTGELLWSHVFGANIINPSPVVSGNLVYISHGEENLEGAPIGRIICLDASQIDAKTKKPKIVWDTFKRKYKENNNTQLAKRFGLASPALADGVLYMADDGGELHAFDAKDGELLWRWKYGTVSRGAPLVVDGKLFIFDVNAKLAVISKLTRKEPESDDVIEYRFKARTGVGFPETNATPIAVNGKLYFQTREDIYCVGDGKAAAPALKYTPLSEETLVGPAVGLQIFPADISTASGAEVKLQLRFVDVNGRVVPAPADAKVEWSTPLPPKTPTGAQPPALKGTVTGDAAGATLVIGKPPETPPAQQGYVDAKVGTMTARARIRVVPQIPFKPNFANIPVGSTPGGWVNTQGKYLIAELKNDKGEMEKVLQKVNTDSRPPIARANAYMSSPSSTGYVVQADMRTEIANQKLPDMGVVANRYLMILDGKPTESTPGKFSRQLRIISWEARNRVQTAVDFDWKPSTWYTVKFTVEIAADKKSALVHGKVWERGQPEPEKWTIEIKDTNPNLEGAPALYGYVSNIEAEPGSPIYYNNVSVTPQVKK